MYRENLIRKENKKNFVKFDDYLKSLKMSVKVFKNDLKIIERITQLIKNCDSVTSNSDNFLGRHMGKFTARSRL